MDGEDASVEAEEAALLATQLDPAGSESDSGELVEADELLLARADRGDLSVNVAAIGRFAS